MRSWVAVLAFAAVLVIFAAPSLTLPRTTLDPLNFSDLVLWLLTFVIVLFQQLPLPELSFGMPRLEPMEVSSPQTVSSVVLIC